MKVAFWSTSRNSGVTSCALAAGYLGAQAMNMRITLLDNHYRDSMLRELVSGPGGAGIQNYRDPRECSWYWTRPGYYSGSFSIFGDTSVELVEEHLWFRYDDISLCGSLYEREFMSLLKKADNGERMCFVDTEVNNNLSSKLILDAADLVVVMLPGNLNLAEVFFEEYRSILGKSLLVFNKSRIEDQLARRRLCEKYRIPPGRVVTMPYVENIKKMVSVGRFRRFLMENATSEQPREGYAYLAAVGRILNVIERENRRVMHQRHQHEDKTREKVNDMAADQKDTGKMLQTNEYGWELL